DHLSSYLYSGYIQMEQGKNRMYRWYVANPVRFQRSLRVEIQNQRFEGDNQLPSADDYMSVALWYQEYAHPAPNLIPYVDRVAPSRSAFYSHTKYAEYITVPRYVVSKFDWSEPIKATNGAQAPPAAHCDATLHKRAAGPRGSGPS